jgi:hypothetical protein
VHRAHRRAARRAGRATVDAFAARAHPPPDQGGTYLVRRRVAGEAVAPLFQADGRRDVDFDDLDPEAAAADYGRFVEECKLADAAVAGASLDDTFVLDGEPHSLRLVYLHLIQEYARHNGHADLLRQRIDGVTGA